MGKIPLSLFVRAPQRARRCMACGQQKSVIETTLQLRGQPIRKTHLCATCLDGGISIDLDLEYGTDPQQSQECKKRLRAARQTEQSVARAVGGRTQPASGAARACHCKADVRCPGWMVEVKYTDARRYALCIQDLEKVGRQAAKTGANPAFVVDFRQACGRYVILPFNLFQEFTDDTANQHQRPRRAAGT